MTYLHKSKVLIAPDGILRCGDGIDLAIHKGILSLHSVVFAGVFQDCNEAVPTNFSSRKMTYVLEDIYKVPHESQMENFRDKCVIFEIANFYQLDGLIDTYRDAVTHHVNLRLGIEVESAIGDLKFLSTKYAHLAGDVDEMMAIHIKKGLFISSDKFLMAYLDCDAYSKSRKAWLGRMLQSKNQSKKHVEKISTKICEWNFAPEILPKLLHHYKECRERMSRTTSTIFLQNPVPEISFSADNDKAFDKMRRLSTTSIFSLSDGEMSE